MIDFQDSGLEHQVYELIAEMCNLTCSDSFPRFETKLLENDIWECKLAIPGVKRVAVAKGLSEVDSINACATNMLGILRTEHDKNQYDPEIEENIFEQNIQQFFSVKYDNRYRYHLCQADILLDQNDNFAYRLLKSYASKTVDGIMEEGGEIDSMSDIVTIRFLVKEQKKDYYVYEA